MAEFKNHGAIFNFENRRNNPVKKTRESQWPGVQESLNQLFRVKGKIRENGYLPSHYQKRYLHTTHDIIFGFAFRESFA